MGRVSGYVAVCAAALLYCCAAKADIIAKVSGNQTTVINQGDAVAITATAQLGLAIGQPFDFDGHTWDLDWFVTSFGITVYDDQGNKQSNLCFGGKNFPCSVFGNISKSNQITEVMDPAVYNDPGTYVPSYVAFFDIIAFRIGDPNNPFDRLCFEVHGGRCELLAEFDYAGSTSLTVLSPTAVPGPIAGTGLPGVLLATCGAFFICRRRSKPSRSSAPLHELSRPRPQ